VHDTSILDGKPVARFAAVHWKNTDERFRWVFYTSESSINCALRYINGEVGMSKVFAFELRVIGTDWKSIINAHTRGQAKGQYFRSVNDCWDVPFTSIRCRKIGAPVTSEGFERNAIYRGWEGVKCGARVKCGDATGVLVGHNSSANFDVLFDLDSPKYAGQKLNVHPADCQLIN
jgi:hypothetical protein